MPLKLLERVLPWLATSLQEEEAKAMFENIRLAGLIYFPFRYNFSDFVFEIKKILRTVPCSKASLFSIHVSNKCMNRSGLQIWFVLRRSFFYL
jgi:hypothetical protein